MSVRRHSPGSPAGRPGRRAGRRSSEPGRQAAICERLVAAAAALGGAQRVLLVLDSSEGPRVAARLLPRRETDAALLRAIAPWLDEARRTGKARLRHGPAGAEPRAQRSCIVAPLRSGRERFGFVYADVEGRRGRFTAADRDRLALLAREAAAALSDVRLTERLALEVKQRDAELAVINRIQQAVGAALDFQAIVDVVGDKLREVFKTDNIGIRWWDEPADRLHYLYLYEHGVRLHVPPVSPTLGTAWEPFFRRRRVAVLNTVAEQDAAGVKALPGTDRALSIVTVPMVAGDRVLGAVNLENHEREHAFGQAEVRLLETIASSMAVALLNARSYEAERQRAAELAIVKGVQAALASRLDVQTIHQLVGDKVRDVFDAQSVSACSIMPRASRSSPTTGRRASMTTLRRARSMACAATSSRRAAGRAGDRHRQWRSRRRPRRHAAARGLCLRRRRGAAGPPARSSGGRARRRRVAGRRRDAGGTCRPRRHRRLEAGRPARQPGGHAGACAEDGLSAAQAPGPGGPISSSSATS
ncbi:MAG: GAF domain-containing protein [Caldimonas sp.]